MAVVDIAGFIADLKDHAAEHGFHVHEWRNTHDGVKDGNELHGEIDGHDGMRCKAHKFKARFEMPSDEYFYFVHGLYILAMVGLPSAVWAMICMYFFEISIYGWRSSPEKEVYRSSNLKHWRTLLWGAAAFTALGAVVWEETEVVLKCWKLKAQWDFP